MPELASTAAEKHNKRSKDGDQLGAASQPNTESRDSDLGKHKANRKPASETKRISPFGKQTGEMLRFQTFLLTTSQNPKTAWSSRELQVARVGKRGS